MIIDAGDLGLIEPYLDLGDGFPVWRWMGDAGVQHIVRIEDAAGSVYWEVWQRSTLLADDLTPARGRAAAEALILKWRRGGLDALHANAVLRANGYTPNQHTAINCNCAGCFKELS